MDKALNMIGMAKRAGKVNTGEFICSKLIKSKKSKLIVIASDSSENTRKSIKNSCVYYNIQYIVHGSMDELGKITGADCRAVISVNDNNFARAILNIYDSK